ncbi:MAG TPA: hypothetical protein VF172_03155 [Nitrososphaera sp.]
MVLGIAVGAAILLYFSLILYVIPESYQLQLRRPEAVVTDVSLSEEEVALGQSFVISVSGTNRGDDADMQIVSIGFPNLTRTDNNVGIVDHNFDQTPDRINAGDEVGSAYGGTEVTVKAQHASIEAFSRPWRGGNTYSIDLRVEPQTEGRFMIFVKSVAFPHSWDGAHWPAEGTVDYQQEFVRVYDVQVTKKP